LFCNIKFSQFIIVFVFSSPDPKGQVFSLLCIYHG